MTEPSQNESKERIKFTNAPINELAIGLFHVPITELRSQHIGIYWNTIRDRYPLCEQQPPIEQPLEVTPLPTDVPVLFQQMPGEVYPLPRFWFSSKVHSTLIQLQRNGFLLNWRRGAEGDYPHYENVEENFWREFLGYKSFVEETLGGKLDVVSRCELTYVNFIGTSEFFSCPADINKVLPPIASLYDVQDKTRRLVGLNTSTTYRLTDNLSL